MDIVTPISGIQRVLAATRLQRIAFSVIAPPEQSSVDISGLGRLLSTSAVLERTLLTGGDKASFNTVAAATRLFSGAYNVFLQSVQSDIPAFTLDSQALARLSSVGINAIGKMTIDMQALELAYSLDPSGTVRLLAQAALSIGKQATEHAYLHADLLQQIAAARGEITPSALPPRIDASNPAIAAAIAAYHMVDGIFDTEWPHDEGTPLPVASYSQIRAIAAVNPVKLNLTV